MAEPMWPAQVRVNPGQGRFDLIWFEATVQATHPFPPLFHQAGGAWGGVPGFMDSYTGRYERCMERKSMIQKHFSGKTLPNLYRSGCFILQVLRYKLR